MKTQMPRLNLDTINAALVGLDTTLDIAQVEQMVARIVANQGKNKGCLRAAKPEVTRHKAGEDRYGRTRYEPDYTEGCAAYIWRNVAFSISPMSQHQCMPVTDWFDLPGPGGYNDERRALCKELDKVVDVIIKTVPQSERHGLRRWGQVLGMVGQPQYNEEGAVVYR